MKDWFRSIDLILIILIIQFNIGLLLYNMIMYIVNIALLYIQICFVFGCNWPSLNYDTK